MPTLLSDTKSIVLPGFLTTLKTTFIILLVVLGACGFFMGVGKILTMLFTFVY